MSAVESLPLPPSRSTPDWFDRDCVGLAVFAASTQPVSEHLPAADDLRTFLTNTDFDTHRLLYVTTAGPHAGYQSLRLGDPDTTEERFSARVQADATATMAAQVVTFPQALFRIQTTAMTARITVVDGWDRSTTLETTVQS